LSEIALILFDLNGVLYNYDRNARIDHLAVVANRPADSIKAAIWDSGFEDSGDAGDLDADAYLRGFATAIGHDLSEAAWVAALQSAITPIEPSLALLPRVRVGVGCAVLTNNNLLVQRHFSSLYSAVASLVGNRACVSAEFGVRKPDRQAYRRCLAQLGVAPEATLFIDDSPANVAGAQAAGLAACHVTQPDQLTAALLNHRLLA